MPRSERGSHLGSLVPEAIAPTIELPSFYGRYRKKIKKLTPLLTTEFISFGSNSFEISASSLEDVV